MGGGGPPGPPGYAYGGTPDFSLTLVLSDIFNRSNFEYSAYSDLKVDSRR